MWAAFLGLKIGEDGRAHAGTGVKRMGEGGRRRGDEQARTEEEEDESIRPPLRRCLLRYLAQRRIMDNRAQQQRVGQRRPKTYDGPTPNGTTDDDDRTRGERMTTRRRIERMDGQRIAKTRNDDNGRTGDRWCEGNPIRRLRPTTTTSNGADTMKRESMDEERMAKRRWAGKQGGGG
ncbi:hypothetical protein BDN70DRAFT_900355 [Pholiota conissans]|uniref:Uncharacterized protein n=1 Tax=Pholiota conissans TaxID=109636 RepID=A0A9P5YMV2_9AGAR|nr:hypothetical protein BDN70DRAFT_900355 [Pholiota conissans]